MPSPRRKFVDVGAGWFKEASNGSRFISGILKIKGENVPINLFENTKKNAERQPDYRISMTIEKAQELGLDYQVPTKDKRSPNSSQFRAEGRKENRYDKPSDKEVADEPVQEEATSDDGAPF